MTFIYATMDDLCEAMASLSTVLALVRLQFFCSLEALCSSIASLSIKDNEEKEINDLCDAISRMFIDDDPMDIQTPMDDLSEAMANLSITPRHDVELEALCSSFESLSIKDNEEKEINDLCDAISRMFIDDDPMDIQTPMDDLSEAMANLSITPRHDVDLEALCASFESLSIQQSEIDDLCDAMSRLNV